MTKERYLQWMAVWKWFQRQKRSDELLVLYGMLNILWEEDRKSIKPEQLRIEDDPEFKKFLKGPDQAFEN